MSKQATDLLKPGFLFLELTNHCNMHCTFCPSDELEKPRTHVAEADAVAFIRQTAALGLSRPIQFSVLGEPLLNKKIYDYIGLCEELGVDVILITNISLLSEERLERIFKHHNVILVLSLQTPTAESFKLRQYSKIPRIEEYLSLVFNAIRAKFRHASRSRIEIHVGSEIGSEMQSDGAPKLWSIFESNSEQREFLQSFVERLTALSPVLRQESPDFYDEEMQRTVAYFHHHFGSGLMELAPDRIVTDAENPCEDTFWGWMFAPNAFLRIKRFGLWAKQAPFVAKHLAPHQFSYIEERTEPLHCDMAGNLTMLADGSFSLCCLDYEGEMRIGNIHTDSVESALRSQLRLDSVENAMLHKVCRRCMGNLFIFDSTPLEVEGQKIDKYGFGWHPFEPALSGRGGRWTQGRGNVYFYLRLRAERFRMSFHSPFDARQELALEISVQGSDGEFSFLKRVAFHGQPGDCTRELPISLEPFRLYRAVICSSVFSPKERYGSDDARMLGLAVFDMVLSGQTAQPEQVETGVPLVQISNAC